MQINENILKQWTGEIHQNFYPMSPKYFSYEDNEVLNHLFQEIKAELLRACSKFNPAGSMHGAFAVLQEEVNELWEAIKADDWPTAQKEAIQVAAMAMRFILDSASGPKTLKQ